MSEKDYVKSQFKAYRYCINNVGKIKKKIEVITEDMTGLHSPSLEEPTIHQSSQSKSDGWYKMMEHKARLENKLTNMTSTIDFVESAIKSLNDEDRSFMEDIYFNRYHHQKVADKYFLTLDGTYKKENRIIAKIEEEL